MHRRRQAVFSLLVVLTLLLTTVAPALAQDLPPLPDGSSRVFVPLVSSGAEQATREITLGGVPAVDSVENADKATEVAPAAVPADHFRLVSIIVVTDPGADPNAIAASAGGQIIHRYSKVFNGVSMILPPDNVDQVANAQGVQKVFLDTLEQPATDVSPTFIGAPTAWQQLGGQQSAGENITVGVLDTGIWPEHPSFSDPDPSGKAYGPPAIAPGSRGFSGAPRPTCNFGNTGANPNDAPFTCNNKLIGAYEFLDTYKAFEPLLDTEFDSARDSEGHGTHTSSTAAGNAGVAASIFSIPRGIVSGVAPRAHVIMYRVCAELGCYSSDSAAAVEQAILDGVNVINFSISGGSNPYSDAGEQAFLSAYNNGVFVAASAGNAGPTADTTDHRGPWVTTVAASTSNRSFVSQLTLTADNGDTLQLSGASVTAGISTPAPVVLAPDPLCGEMAAGSLTGQIVVCDRGVYGRVEKSYNVYAAGGAGMILRNVDLNQELDTDNYWVPGLHISGQSGLDLQAFLSSHTGVTATFTSGQATGSQGDVMAAFSSRGGPGQILGVSKPDITAPGVQILAGHSPLPSTVLGGPPGQLFQAIQGTSMSSPHIAGAGALLKALHPNWTPGQIKSAIMTTAKVEGVVKEDGVTPGNAFDFGSGRVNLNYAPNPGLTFDETGQNYVALKDQLWNANYPSLYIPVMPGRITVSRTVHNELNEAVEWKLDVSAPADVTVSVPRQIRVGPGGNATFQITVDAARVPLGEVRFAQLRLQADDRRGWQHDNGMVDSAQVDSAQVDSAQAGSDQNRGGPNHGDRKTMTLIFPITLVRKQPVVTLTKTCDPAAIDKRGTTTCTITAANTSFSPANVEISDRVPENLQVIRDSVTGAAVRGNTLWFRGTLAPAQPPDVTIAATNDSPGGGYLPLSLFGVPPIPDMDDEVIANFNVPSFVYAGETYSQIGVVSDGYVVVGGGTGADVQFENQQLPDATPPNNVLAPFWTDLNPALGGAVRIGVLTDGVNDWVVVDYDGVVNYGDINQPNSFQIWIGINGVQDITYAYGPVTNGEGGLLTIGAENRFGNRGQNYYYNGTGTVPGVDGQLRVSATALAPGGTQVITFRAKADRKGPWTNCAEMSSDLFQGVNIACFSGTVNR